MTDLTQKVLARAEFDGQYLYNATKTESAFIEGKQVENARLLPIIQELLALTDKMAEALECDENHHDNCDHCDLFDTAKNTRRSAISEYSRVMKGMAEGK